MRLVRSLGGASILAVTLALPACAVRAYPPTIGGYASVYADDVPANIYAYPHLSFEGGYAYLVNDRWYYPSQRGWVILREEPRELYRYRSTYVHHAPPAYPPGPAYRRGTLPRQSAPPAQYAYPPPATRVR